MLCIGAKRALMGGPGRWALSEMFRNGKVGVALPPLSDFSKLFQDAGRTVPVTAIGQNVASATDASGNGNHIAFTGVTLQRDSNGYYFLSLAASTGVTPSINFTGTNKVTTFIAFRREATVVAVLLELSANSTSGAGKFAYLTSNSGASKDSVVLAGSSSFEYPNFYSGVAPVFNIATIRQDISATTQITRTRVRLNGAEVTLTTAGNTGNAGNLSDNPLYIGSRAGGATYRFAGRIYGLAVVGDYVSDAVVAKAEALLLSRSGTGDGAVVGGVKVLALGDSTIAAYAGGNAVLDLISQITRVTVAVPGHSISQQKTSWQALSVGIRQEQVAVFIQVGLNDMAPAEAASVAIARLQDLVNTVLADVSVGCRVYISQMIPCKQRWIDIYGAVNGVTAQAKWVAMNDAIAGNGATPITGASARITSHVALLDDASGNLDAAYDTGDHIHPNNAGRTINAAAWQAQLLADGLVA